MEGNEEKNLNECHSTCEKKMDGVGCDFPNTK